VPERSERNGHNYEIGFATNNLFTGSASDFVLRFASFAPVTRNWFFFKNDRVDELTLAADATLDQEERKKLFGEAQDHIWEGKAIIPIKHSEELYGAVAEIEGIVTEPFTESITYHNAYFKK
jgi:ABC-type transport system substrate-binding protein